MKPGVLARRAASEFAKPPPFFFRRGRRRLAGGETESRRDARQRKAAPGLARVERYNCRLRGRVPIINGRRRLGEYDSDPRVAAGGFRCQSPADYPRAAARIVSRQGKVLDVARGPALLGNRQSNVRAG